MNTDDDFISRLMDETYNSVEHPSNELSNHNVKSLSDYFSKREDSLVSENVKFYEYESFYRIEVSNNCLDIPKNLGWVNETKGSGLKVFEVKDNVLCGVLEELHGEKITSIEVDSTGRATFSSSHLSKIKPSKVA